MAGSALAKNGTRQPQLWNAASLSDVASGTLVEIHGHDEFFARDGFGAGEHGPAPIAELVTRVGAGPAACDAIRIGHAQQHAGSDFANAI